MSIADNLRKVRSEIALYADRAGVSPDSVELVAVSKTHPASAVLEAYEAGQRAFGENRVQEWLEKAPALPSDIEWNLIGHLQTNKVKYIVGTKLALLQSLDRLDLAQDLQKRCAREDWSIDVLVQLNIAREDTKSGVLVEDVDRFLEELVPLDRLRIRGLMTIGPNTDDEAAIRDCFAQARKIYERLEPHFPTFQHLSMGMSHDFGLAILEGSNMIRVGTSIFGARSYGPETSA